MIDNVTFKIPLLPPQEVVDHAIEPFEYMGLIFSPVYSYDIIKCYTAKLDNLKLILSFEGLTVSNSIHKYHKGNNHSDFSLSEIIVAIEKLEVRLQFNAIDAKIKKIEFATNIMHNPKEVYSNWISYKSTQPSDMRQKNRVYGSKVFLTDYCVKGYDKAYEVKQNSGDLLSEPMFRLEVQIKNVRYINKRKSPLNVFSLHDLKSRAAMSLVCNELLSIYDTIEKVPPLKSSHLSTDDTRYLGYMTNARSQEMMKQNHPSTYKRDRKDYTAFVKQHQDTEASEVVRNKLKDKLTYLLNH